MAEVYVAKTKGIGGFEKLVAIKVIHPRYSQDEHFIQMLVEEAKIAVQLAHVNIAQIFDLGCIDETYFIAMEYVEGADLFRIQKQSRKLKQPLPIDSCCYIISEVCNGLGYAHRKNDARGEPLKIVHRDISPQNVLVSHAGEVKLVDFGIAKAALRTAETEVGVIKGKYYYMSPEQAWGDPVDERTDVFSAGVVLYELLTGEMLHKETAVPKLLDAVRKANIPTPRVKRPEIPEELAKIVLKAVEKEAADRFATAEAFGEAISGFMYARNPTFTAAQLGRFMTDILSREPAGPVPEPSEPRPATESIPSGEFGLGVMQRNEFKPGGENSVIFNVRELAAKAAAPKVGTAKGKARVTARALPQPRGRGDEPYTKPTRAPDPDEWDEETLLKRNTDWDDDSTLIDDQGQMMAQVHKRMGRPRSATDSTAVRESPSESPETSARARRSTRPLPPVPPPPRATSSANAPSHLSGPEVDGGADEVSDAGPTLVRNPSGSSSAPTWARESSTPSMSQPVSVGSEASLSDPSISDLSISGPVQSSLPSHSQSQPPTLSQPSLPMGVGGPSYGGGGPVGMDAGQFAPPGAVEDEPPVPLWRRWWVLGILMVFVGFAGASAVWGLNAAARPHAVLEVRSVPAGAAVDLDGERLPGRTPLRVEGGLKRDRRYPVVVTLPGYEPYRSNVQITSGTQQQIFVLNPLRTTLVVRTRPAGARVSVDSIPRGISPLELHGLEPGTRVTVRAELSGYGTVERRLELTDPTESIEFVLTPTAP